MRSKRRENIWGRVAGEGEFENSGQEPLGPQKKYFKFLGPFFGAPGALTHYFRIPLLPLRVPIFFRRFDLIYRFLLHGTTFLLLLGLVNIFLRSKFMSERS